MTEPYEPFEIKIEPLVGGSFPLRVSFQGIEREASIPGDLPLIRTEELRQVRQWLERGFIDRPYAQDFGGRLFQTLFPAEIESFFREAIQRVEPEGGLRILLNFPLPQGLNQIPWELLYDPKGIGFLARSVTAPMVRHYTDLPLPHELPEEGPLRVLVVTASPAGKPPVSTLEEIEKIASRLSKASYSISESIQATLSHVQSKRSLRGLRQRLLQRRLVEMDILTEATRGNLQARMITSRSDNRPYHIIHFVGHGETDEEGSRLLLEDGPISASDFAEIISEPSVNLAVINACESAAEELLDSVAEACLRARIPAVIGMQVPVLDRAALEFAREFYSAWASGEPIESSLAYARRLISQQSTGSAADWSIPVLYMGPEEGLTLELEPAPIRVPWQFRAIRWSAAALLSILGTTALLLQVPDIAKSVRQQVPIINCLYPYPLQEDPSFNIAIIEFGMLAPSGKISNNPDGEVVARDLFKRLNAGVGELNLPISHDLGDGVFPCPIKGESKAKIEENADRFARKVNADILIYGFLIEENDRTYIKPEFFVDYRGFHDAAELVGDHSMGEKIRVILPIRESDLDEGENRTLQARNKALIDTVRGLASYALDNFDQALVYFQEAEKEDGWLDSQGKEVIYLLSGNSLAKKAGLIREVSDQEHAELLSKAKEAYLKSIELNPTYARGQLALAGILYQEALGDPSVFLPDKELLNQAEQAFISAMGIPDAPESANIVSKAHFGLGQLNSVRAMMGKSIESQSSSGEEDLEPFGLPSSEESFAIAEEHFQTLLDDYKNGDDRLVDLASQAYANLAFIERTRENFDEAVGYLNQAIEIASPYYRVRFYALLGDTYHMAGDLDQAVLAYQDAIDFAKTTGDEKTIDEITNLLAQIEQK